MRCAVLVSGEGTTLQALLDAEAERQLEPATIACVLCNRAGAPAVERARAAGKPTIVLDHRDYPNREAFERAMLAELAQHEVELIVLAGFMRILTEVFIGAYSGRIINTHPSLLPAFPGMHAAQQALDHGVRVSGCTIHVVESGVDSGPIIAQAAVPVLDDDDASRLQQRIQAQERHLLVQVLPLLASGKLVVRGRRVHTA